MEFPFSIIEIFPDEISVIDKQLSINGTSITNLRGIKDQIGEVLDMIGEASAIAQKLTHPITTKEKVALSDDRIYIMRSSEKHQNKVVGFLKVGTKNLFLFDTESNYHELQPLCILDFYVHESMQRQGCGKQLFEFMLKNENISPHQLAINRPSSKLLSFLCKHYNLKSRIPQINNFVVFSNFFQGRQVPRNRRQWRYDDDDDDDFPRTVGNTPYSRLTSLGVRSKSQVPILPSINSRHSDSYQYVRNTSSNNSATLDRRSNDNQSKADAHRVPFSMENQDLNQQRGMCFSAEIFDLKAQPGSNIFGDNNRYPVNSTSAGHLNLRRRQDTAWNIFGVSSASSTCRGSKNSSMADRKRSTLFW